MIGIYSIWSDPVFNVGPISSYHFQSSRSIVFPVFRIFAVSFVDESYCNVLNETIMAIIEKMFIQMFLHAMLPFLKFFVIRFIITPS